jgi:parallel beta-helix repeat protein
LYSDNNYLRNNYIRNSTNGIILNKSNNNTIIANEIYDCGDYGIKVYFASNNTRIIENYIYNNGGYTGADQIDIHVIDCYGTVVEGNFFRYREIIPPEFPWLYIILAVAIIAAGVTIGVVLYRRHRRKKEYKHPEPPEFPEPDEPPAATEQVDLPEPPELDED